MLGKSSTASCLVGALAVLFVPLACSKPPISPQDEIRHLITQLEEAAREKDLPKLKAHISAQYRDEEGRDKNALKGLLAYYFLQNRSIHLLTRVQSVELTAPDAAQIRVVTALAGTQIPSAALLPQMRADIYQFEADLSLEDGEWRVIRATWEPATLDDLQ